MSLPPVNAAVAEQQHSQTAVTTNKGDGVHPRTSMSTNSVATAQFDDHTKSNNVCYRKIESLLSAAASRSDDMTDKHRLGCKISDRTLTSNEWQQPHSDNKSVISSTTSKTNNSDDHVKDDQLPATESIGATSNEIITNPHENDVLCGRGGRINSHAGNLKFREIVKSLKTSYTCPFLKRKDKASIAAEVVLQIQRLQPPGRFLTEHEGGGGWMEVSAYQALRKAGQALREISPNDFPRDPKDTESILQDTFQMSATNNSITKKDQVPANEISRTTWSATSVKKKRKFSLENSTYQYAKRTVSTDTSEEEEVASNTKPTEKESGQKYVVPAKLEFYEEDRKQVAGYDSNDSRTHSINNNPLDCPRNIISRSATANFTNERMVTANPPSSASHHVSSSVLVRQEQNENEMLRNRIRELEGDKVRMRMEICALTESKESLLVKNLLYEHLLENAERKISSFETALAPLLFAASNNNSSGSNSNIRSLS